MLIIETLEGENSIHTNIIEREERLPNSYSKSSKLRCLRVWVTSSPSKQIINFNFYVSII